MIALTRATSTRSTPTPIAVTLSRIPARLPGQEQATAEHLPVRFDDHDVGAVRSAPAAERQIPHVFVLARRHAGGNEPLARKAVDPDPRRPRPPARGRPRDHHLASLD